MNHGAIETVYRGCKFRSRLEARWAVFFDWIGMEWTYEEQGYEAEGHRYLPDFLLPKVGVWCEVKGDPDGLRADCARMSLMLGPNSPMPDIATGGTGIVILSDLPEVSFGMTVLHPFLSRTSGPLDRTWATFVGGNGREASMAIDRRPSYLYGLFQKHNPVDMAGNPASSGWDTAPWLLDTTVQLSAVLEGYRAARRARFEHGEHGA